MTWVRLSDDMFEDYERRSSGPLASFLFVLALGKCAQVDGDGLLPALMVKDAAGLYDLRWKQLAPKLVASGDWHTAESVLVCESCMENGGARCVGDAWFIHEWWTLLLDAKGKDDRVHRWRESRKRDLAARPDLRGFIRRRDRDLCRYCGVLTRWDGDRKSRTAGTYDHRDPFCTDGEKGYGNTPANLVVACRTCNGRKKDRTPEQADMALRPEPGPYQVPIKGGSGDGSSPDLDAIGDLAPGSLAGAHETGRTRVPPGSPFDPSLDRPGGETGLRAVPETTGVA